MSRRVQRVMWEKKKKNIAQPPHTHNLWIRLTESKTILQNSTNANVSANRLGWVEHNAIEREVRVYYPRCAVAVIQGFARPPGPLLPVWFSDRPGSLCVGRNSMSETTNWKWKCSEKCRYVNARSPIFPDSLGGEPRAGPAGWFTPKCNCNQAQSVQ